MDVNEILAEREKTHGDFERHAEITQTLKVDMYRLSNWERLSEMQKESLDMIVHKIGRILAGNPDHKDHWADIAGYAQLIANRLD